MELFITQMILQVPIGGYVIAGGGALIVGGFIA